MGTLERDDADTPRLTLTRRETAAKLGVSISTVRRYEWDELHPEMDSRGVLRFDPAEVDALKNASVRRPVARAKDTGSAERRARAREGRLAAQVFRLFARNQSLPQIVLTTRQPPDAIRRLYQEWSTSLEEAEWKRRSTES